MASPPEVSAVVESPVSPPEVHLSFSPYIDINVFLKIAKGYLETISKAAAVQRQKARTRFLNSFLFQNLGMALRGQENSRDMAV